MEKEFFDDIDLNKLSNKTEESILTVINNQQGTSYSSLTDNLLKMAAHEYFYSYNLASNSLSRVYSASEHSYKSGVKPEALAKALDVASLKTSEVDFIQDKEAIKAQLPMLIADFISNTPFSFIS